MWCVWCGVCVYMYVHMYVCIHVCVYVCVHVSVCIYTVQVACTYIYTCACDLYLYTHLQPSKFEVVRSLSHSNYSANSTAMLQRVSSIHVVHKAVITNGIMCTTVI